MEPRLHRDGLRGADEPRVVFDIQRCEVRRGGGTRILPFSDIRYAYHLRERYKIWQPYLYIFARCARVHLATPPPLLYLLEGATLLPQHSTHTSKSLQILHLKTGVSRLCSTLQTSHTHSKEVTNLNDPTAREYSTTPQQCGGTLSQQLELLSHASFQDSELLFPPSR